MRFATENVKPIGLDGIVYDMVNIVSKETKIPMATVASLIIWAALEKEIDDSNDNPDGLHNMLEKCKRKIERIQKEKSKRNSN